MYIIYIKNQQLFDIFNNLSKIEKVINSLQIAFIVWNKIPNNVNFKNDIFIYFFSATCLIEIKVILINLIYRTKIKIKN